MSVTTLAKQTPMRAASILLALALAVTITSLASARPAHATAGGCPSGHSCIWRDKNYKTDGSNVKAGRIFNKLGAFTGQTYFKTNKSMHDSASSAANAGTKCRFTWYANEWYQGKPFSLKKNHSEPNLSLFGFNDMADSGEFC